jgi:hypothetical protein
MLLGARDLTRIHYLSLFDDWLKFVGEIRLAKTRCSLPTFSHDSNLLDSQSSLQNLQSNLGDATCLPTFLRVFSLFSHPRLTVHFQTRRGARTTRTAALKDNENANARPSRITSRAKPLSNVAIATATTSTAGVRATAATAASRAKAGVDLKADLAAQGKRKREALREVTSLVTNNKAKSTVAKAVVRPTTRRTTRSTIVTQQHEVRDLPVEVHADDAMVVDEQPPAHAYARRVSTRKSTQSATSVATRHSEIHRRGSARSIAQPVIGNEDEDDRVFKKRRTSSEVPEVNEGQPQTGIETANDAPFEAFVDQEWEADPEGDQWVDLDAEDADDPLMVSEYVVDIFRYMKDIEVHFISILMSTINAAYSTRRCRTQRTWRIRKTSLGKCAGSLMIG